MLKRLEELVNEEVVKWKSCDQHPFFQYFCRTRPAAIRCYNVSWRVQETLPLTLTHSTLYVLRADYSLYAPTWTKAFDCNCTGRKRNSEDGTTIDRKDVLFLALSLTDLKSGISPLLPPAGFLHVKDDAFTRRNTDSQTSQLWCLDGADLIDALETDSKERLVLSPKYFDRIFHRLSQGSAVKQLLLEESKVEQPVTPPVVLDFSSEPKYLFDILHLLKEHKEYGEAAEKVYRLWQKFEPEHYKTPRDVYVNFNRRALLRLPPEEIAQLSFMQFSPVEDLAFLTHLLEGTKEEEEVFEHIEILPEKITTTTNSSCCIC